VDIPIGHACTLVATYVAIETPPDVTYSTVERVAIAYRDW